MSRKEIYNVGYSCAIKEISIDNDININDDINIIQYFDDLNDVNKWIFILGYMHGSGGVIHDFDRFECYINGPLYVLELFKNYCSYPSIIINKTIKWIGVNALDFLGKIYSIKISDNILNFTPYCDNYKKYVRACSNSENLPCFRYTLDCDEKYKPQKNRESDAGYDLHLIEKIKENNGVHYYDTKVAVQPDVGYYFELVGRSSIAKTGYMLANNIGIIDSNYRGNIIVALIKVNPNAPELQLPMKLVQLIPRKQIFFNMIQVEKLDSTDRNDDGGLGSKNVK